MDIEFHEGMKIFEVLNRLVFMERKSSFSYEGVELYPSEIHMMLAIGKNQATNATRMAESLGVTKGAVSQTLARLEKKGVVNKEKDHYNKNELTVCLTDLGSKAYDKYYNYSMRLVSSLDAFMNTLSDNEHDAVIRFVECIDEAMHMKG